MRVKLGDIFEIGSGGTPSKAHPEYYGGNIPWVKTGDLKNEYLYEAEDFITEEGLNNSSAKIYEENTVLIAMYGATIGATSILKMKACTNQACAAFRKNEQVIPEYLYYFLRSKKEKFAKDGVGGAQPNISAGYLKKIEMELPSLDEQKVIVGILDKISDIGCKRRFELQSLDDLIKARFVELFGDPVLNPFSWEMKRFDEICENLDSRRKPISSGDRVEGIYPYYGASGIVDYVEDYIFNEDILLVSEDGANLLMRSIPIAFSVSGKVWVNNHAHVVRFDKMSLQKYVEIYFSLIDISDSITGSAQPKLNQAKLNAIMLPIPEDMLLDRYCEFLYQVNKSKFSVIKERLWKRYLGLLRKLY